MTGLQVLPSWSEHIEHLALPLMVTSLSPAKTLDTLKVRANVVTASVRSIFFMIFPFVLGSYGLTNQICTPSLKCQPCLRCSLRRILGFEQPFTAEVAQV